MARAGRAESPPEVRMRRRTRLTSDDRGVASTVGTLMSVLVFLTLLNLIITQFVPVWMEDAESAHGNTALGQFGGIKEAIDLQNLAAQNTEAEYVPVTGSSAVVLGVDGVPLFAPATVGRLTADPDAGPFVVTFDYLVQAPLEPGLRTRVQEESRGVISLRMPNRYYVPQDAAYVNGAVIRSQSDGQVVRAPPTFLVSSSGTSMDVRFDLVSLYGSGDASGVGAEVVNCRLFATDSQLYEAFPADARIWINHTSRFGLAWYQFLNETLAESLGLEGAYASTPLDQSFTARIGAAVVYAISVSYVPTTKTYLLRLEIRNNPGVLEIGSFRLGHARVQVGVGDDPENSLR